MNKNRNYKNKEFINWKLKIMKIKGLLLGMFACAALVACTNDDIVENNNIEQPEKVKLTLH